MPFVYPNYYKDFACIKGECRHSCCIGWEIDIDEDTLAYYDTVGGEIGARLQDAIVRSDTPFFRLAEHDRCPFLSGEGLCDLILTLGEGALCEICTEHPRFYNVRGDRTECGLGLACEAAARLILLSETPFSLVGTEPLSEETDALILLRDEVIRTLSETEDSLDVRISAARELCGAKRPVCSADVWAERFLALEHLDGAWPCLLRSVLETERTAEASEQMPKTAERVFGNFLLYLVYRHMIQAESPSDAAAIFGFIEVSYCLLSAIYEGVTKLGEDPTHEKLIDLLRLYSSEIEYSDENVDAIKAYCYA